MIQIRLAGWLELMAQPQYALGRRKTHNTANMPRFTADTGSVVIRCFEALRRVSVCRCQECLRRIPASLARRLQTGRCQPIIDMRGGLDQARPAKHRVTLRAGAECRRVIPSPQGFQCQEIPERRFRLVVLDKRHIALLITGGSLQHSQSPVSARGGAVMSELDTL